MGYTARRSCACLLVTGALYLRLRTFFNSGQVSVLTTSPGSSQPRLAWAMPKRMRASSFLLWASVETAMRTPRFFRHLAVNVCEVEAVRLGVQLQDAAPIRAASITLSMSTS